MFALISYFSHMVSFTLIYTDKWFPYCAMDVSIVST